MSERVALVTGGGRGIGREAALLLAAAGTRVMVVARSATELAAVGLDYVAADLGTPRAAPWPLPKPSGGWGRSTCWS